MRSDYRLYIRHEVYQALGAIRGRDRQRILSFLESLSSDPFHEGHYSEPDSTGRRIEAVIVGRFAVYYWADHPAREVKVVDLADADR